MQRQIEIDLQKLKEKILAMGGFVEQSIEEATQGLIQRDIKRFDKVFECELKINAHQIEVDEECVKLLAKQSPLAADLRMVVAILKISTDLERMGDQAKNIALNSKILIQSPEVKPLIELPQMARDVRKMVRDSLDALISGDVALAQHVIKSDDGVDDFKNRILTDLTSIMRQNPNIIEQAVTLILVARNLERIGDHATNIAEDLIYAISGRDVRHGAGKEKSSSG